MTDHLSYRLLLILSRSRQLLGVPHGEGVSLARISVPRWTRQAEQLTQAIATMWQLRVVVLDFLPPNDSGEFCAVVEVRSDDFAEAMGQFAFADPANLPSTELNDAERDVLDSIISQKRSPRGPFSRIGWIDEVQAWIQDAIQDRAMVFTDDICQLNAGPTFTLLRLETKSGLVYWLKATGDPNRHEYDIVENLSKCVPEYLPKLIATRKDWNAWITCEGGKPLRDQLTPCALANAFTSLAELQKKSVSFIPGLLDSGCADLRLRNLSEQLPGLIRYLQEAMEQQTSAKAPPLSAERLGELQQIIQACCKRIETLHIPDTLNHNDINLGNILFDQHQCVFIDWAEAYVGNPFFTFQQFQNHLSINPRDKQTGIEASNCYIQSWRELLSQEQIDSCIALAPLLSILCYLHGRGRWKDQAVGNHPHVQSYNRSLARRLDAAAKNPLLLETL